MVPVTIEVCVESVESAISASEAGCHRLELCRNLAFGGITPQLGCLLKTILSVSQPVIALVRLRPGDFCYSANEQAAMLGSTAMFFDSGAAGVAAGAIQGNNWDLSFMRQIAQCSSRSHELVAHRAIDELIGPQPLSAIRIAEIVQPLIDLGFRRILTSGGYPDAQQGIDNIRRLIDFADGRIEILPGGGITPENATAILSATGARQIHGSFQRLPRNPGQVIFDAQKLNLIKTTV